MIENTTVTHHIQKHIIDVLMYQESARFRDLRPVNTDTNLFSYHLTALLKQGVVEKNDQGYTLSPRGLSYVDRVSTETKTIRSQPKIITMLVIQNEEGDILLQKRRKQPYINTWTLPYGKLHIEDATTLEAAQREAFEKLGLENPELEAAGDCYIRVRVNKEILSTTLAHIFRFYTNTITERDDLVWARPHKLAELKLSPAVEEIMTRTFFKDAFYFEEYEANY